MVNNCSTVSNRQRPVSPRNPRRHEYERAADKYLRERGLPGIL